MSKETLLQMYANTDSDKRFNPHCDSRENCEIKVFRRKLTDAGSWQKMGATDDDAGVVAIKPAGEEEFQYFPIPRRGDLLMIDADWNRCPEDLRDLCEKLGIKIMN
ncbi:MAG: hypothetical protein SGJ20_17100 [Planctomycetota bacterium]|nr:hypothetical protein [Planctomycetota bacterium]